MRVIFADTNLFIQCYDLSQIPWHNIFSDEKLLIIVSRTVLDEIDRHKQDGNARRAKRARKASSLFRSIILSESTKAIIRNDAPHVELSFATHPEHRGHDYRLDLSRPDDRIIDEAIQYAALNPNDEVELLTYDTTPILTARRCGLSVSIIPDNWLLPPEPDPRDKRIADLEQKIRIFENTYPQIEIIVRDDSDESLDNLLVSITTYQAFSGHVLDELVSNVSKRRPISTKFNEPIITRPSNHTHMNLIFGVEEKYYPPTEKEISKYTNEEYPEWLHKVKSFFAELSMNYEYPERCITLSFAVSNSGSVPVENILIEFEAVGGLIFFSPPSNKDSKHQTKNKLPPPPSPPKGKWVQKQKGLMDIANSFQAPAAYPFSRINDFDAYLHNTIPEPIDRNAFYWKEGKSRRPTSKWSFKCREFLHKVGPEIFPIELFVTPKEKIENCAIKCLITASNLPEPIRKTLPIKVQYKEGNIEKLAEDILNESMPIISISKGAGK